MVNTRLTEQEYASLVEAAATTGVSVSEYVRAAALSATPGRARA